MNSNEFLAQRIEAFSIIISSFNDEISYDDVKDELMRIVLIISSSDGTVSESECDYINLIFGYTYTVFDLEAQVPSRDEIESFWSTVPSILLKLSKDIDTDVLNASSEAESLANMYYELVVDIMLACIYADEVVDARENDLFERYCRLMKTYIKGKY